MTAPALRGYSQAARHWTLTPIFAGSNPAIPAINHKGVIMTRSKYIKLRMASGLSRNQAAAEAKAIQSVGLPYSAADRLSNAFSSVVVALCCLGSECLALSDVMARFRNADVVQRQNIGLPSRVRGFDSRYPLQGASEKT